MLDHNREQNSFTEMLLEHRELHRLLEQVRQALATGANGQPGVAGVLAALSDQLQQHFEAEEAAGYVSIIVHETPWAAPRIEVLTSQHDELMADLRQLVGLATEGRPHDGPHWEELTTRFDRFSVQLMRHEGEENELLQQAFTQDIGLKD